MSDDHESYNCAGVPHLYNEFGDYHFEVESFDYWRCRERVCPNRYDVPSRPQDLDDEWFVPSPGQIPYVVSLPPSEEGSPTVETFGEELEADRTVTLDHAPIVHSPRQAYSVLLHPVPLPHEPTQFLSRVSTPALRPDFEAFLANLRASVYHNLEVDTH